VESKNELRVTGIISSVVIETGKNGKEIAKFVMETDPPAWMTNVTAKDKMQLLVFGKTVAEAKKLKEGQTVSVLGRVRGREYNGKWYSDNIAEQMKVLAESKKPAHTPEPGGPLDDSDGIPF
jgi:hypothetical protein